MTYRASDAYRLARATDLNRELDRIEAERKPRPVPYRYRVSTAALKGAIRVAGTTTSSWSSSDGWMTDSQRSKDTNHLSGDVASHFAWSENGRSYSVRNRAGLSALAGYVQPRGRWPLTMDKAVKLEERRLERYTKRTKEQFDQFSKRQDQLRESFLHRKEKTLADLETRLKDARWHLTWAVPEGKLFRRMTKLASYLKRRIQQVLDWTFEERSFKAKPYVWKYVNLTTATPLVKVWPPGRPPVVMLPVHHWKVNFGRYQLTIKAKWDHEESESYPDWDYYSSWSVHEKLTSRLHFFVGCETRDPNGASVMDTSFRRTEFAISKNLVEDGLKRLLPRIPKRANLLYLAVKLPKLIFTAEQIVKTSGDVVRLLSQGAVVSGSKSARRLAKSIRLDAKLQGLRYSDIAHVPGRVAEAFSPSGALDALHYLSCAALTVQFGLGPVWSGLKTLLDAYGKDVHVIAALAERIYREQGKPLVRHILLSHNASMEREERDFPSFAFHRAWESEWTSSWGDESESGKDSGTYSDLNLPGGADLPQSSPQGIPGNPGLALVKTSDETVRLTVRFSYRVVDWKGDQVTNLDDIVGKLFWSVYRLYWAPSVLWKSIPYTFAIDWVVNVSSLFERFTDRPWLRFVPTLTGICLTRKVKHKLSAHLTKLHTESEEGAEWDFSLTGQPGQHEEFQRMVLDPAQFDFLGDFALDPTVPTAWQQLLGLELILQRL